MPQAEEVFLVWGVNDWNILPEELHPAGTVTKDGLLYTPMIHKDDVFAVELNVPAGTKIDYVFQTTKIYNEFAIEVWDVNGDSKEDYHTIATESAVVEITATPTLTKRVETLDGPLITQEIRYHMPEAGEVFFVWGVNDWIVLPIEIQSLETVVNNGVMHTLMVQEGDSFVATLQVPVGTVLDYLLTDSAP
jgi:hypothetical protein